MLRANHAPYVTKALRKAIMKRSYSEKLYFKKRIPESMKKYREKKMCKLYTKEQRKYFENLNPLKIVDNKTSWKNIQLLFSEKRNIRSQVKRTKLLFEDSLVSEETNFFFQNTTKNLDINQNSYTKDETNESTDTVEKAIHKYANHPSILLIKNNFIGATPFLFKEASLEDIEKEMLHLNPKKAGTFQDIPSRILKSSRSVCSETHKLFFLMIQ